MTLNVDSQTFMDFLGWYAQTGNKYIEINADELDIMYKLAVLNLQSSYVAKLYNVKLSRIATIGYNIETIIERYKLLTSNDEFKFFLGLLNHKYRNLIGRTNIDSMEKLDEGIKTGSLMKERGIGKAAYTYILSMYNLCKEDFNKDRRIP